MEDKDSLKSIYQKLFQKYLKKNVEKIAENTVVYREKETEYDAKLVCRSNQIMLPINKNRSYYYPIKILEYLYLSYSPKYMQIIMDHTNIGDIRSIIGMMNDEGRIHIYKRLHGNDVNKIAAYILNRNNDFIDDSEIYAAAARCMNSMVELFDISQPQIPPPHKEDYPQCDKVFTLFIDYFRKEKLQIFIERMKTIIDMIEESKKH